MRPLQDTWDHHGNPIDLLEELVNANDWSFERYNESELLVNIVGKWCDYHLCFIWKDEVAAIFFSCHIDQKVPSEKRAVVTDLLAAVNEKLWLGHFDLFSDEGALVFRHTVPLRGLPGASVEQLEDLVDTAVEECERFYPAVQLVVWGGQSPSDALNVALLETAGEA